MGSTATALPDTAKGSSAATGEHKNSEPRAGRKDAASQQDIHASGFRARRVLSTTAMGSTASALPNTAKGSSAATGEHRNTPLAQQSTLTRRA